MAKCTEDMMVRAFDIYHTQEKDINPLIEMGMNENSAKDTIKSYDKLLNGELHTRQVPIILVKVILKTLYERKEKDKLSNVISALDKKYEFRYREYNELNQGARKIVDEYRKKIYGRMINKFFAYHGPQNLESFNYKGGYGVAQESKWKKVNDGDLVYIIQNIHKNFEFCGIYRVVSHYKNENIESKNHFRFQLEDTTNLDKPVEINEELCGQKLPLIHSPTNWSNFKRHFCSQGATFRNPLPGEVLAVLNQLLPKKKEFQFAEEVTEKENNIFFEGAKQMITINRYERDHNARKSCIEYYGYICKICNFDFEKTYGKIGKHYIHVHHLIPLSEIGEEYIVNPKTHLVPVCPNCHAMLHRSENPNDIDALKRIIKK